MMSVSFPAFHEEQIRASRPASELLQHIKQRAAQLNWHRLHKEQDELSFKVSVSWSSWGEKVHVSVANGAVVIRSECAFPLQCFDWGKNQANVHALCASLAA